MLEKLGLAVGPMVVNKLDRIMKVRLTAHFVETGSGEYGLLWRYSEFGAVKIAMCPKEFGLYTLHYPDRPHQEIPQPVRLPFRE